MKITRDGSSHPKKSASEVRACHIRAEPFTERKCAALPGFTDRFLIVFTAALITSCGLKKVVAALSKYIKNAHLAKVNNTI